MTYHPIQKLKHLTNRLDANNAHRDDAIRRKQQLEAAYKANMTHVEQELTTCRETQKALMLEGQELLPELRGFPKCHNSLQVILSNF